MARRKKSEDKRVKLNAEEIGIAVPRMMAAAQAHRRAAIWCLCKPEVKPVDSIYFPVVAFELLLPSVEQSLRLLYASSPLSRSRRYKP